MAQLKYFMDILCSNGLQSEIFLLAHFHSLIIKKLRN